MKHAKHCIHKGMQRLRSSDFLEVMCKDVSCILLHAMVVSMHLSVPVVQPENQTAIAG